MQVLNESIDVALEKHYTIRQVSDLWNLDYRVVQRMFIAEPGVLVERSEGTISKRRYTTLRIPESVVVRVHRTRRPSRA